MNWIMLFIASVFEIGFATCLGKLKNTSGNVFWMWSAGFLICLVLSIYFLYRATQTLPLGTSYAIWTGLGAVGIALIGIFFFHEPANFWRVFFMATLIASIVGLKLVTPDLH